MKQVWIELSIEECALVGGAGAPVIGSGGRSESEGRAPALGSGG
jgi:hypothetical protein